MSGLSTPAPPQAVNLRQPSAITSSSMAAHSGAPSLCRQQRRQDRPNVSAGVEDTGSQRTLSLRKPFGDGFDGCREIAGFSEAQTEARNAELKGAAGERVAHCGKTPDAHEDAIANARAEAVDVSSGVERSPGLKDPAKIRAFLARAQAL